MNISQLAQKRKDTAEELEMAEKSLMAHPRVKEWLDYVLRIRPYFSATIEGVYPSDDGTNMVVQYWTNGGGVDWVEIPISVLESGESIPDYYKKPSEEAQCSSVFG